MFDENFFADLEREYSAEQVAIANHEIRDEQRREELTAEATERYYERMDEHFAPSEYEPYI